MSRGLGVKAWLGNLAASFVRKYLKCTKEEQATAGLTLKQSTPFFVDKLERLLDHLNRQLEECKIDPKRYISCAEVRPTSKPCFSLGTDLETLARFAQIQSSGFPMMMGYSVSTHGEKHFVETDRIF